MRSLLALLALLVIVGAGACSEREPTEADLGPAPPAEATTPRDDDVASNDLNPRLLRRFRPLHPAPRITSEPDAARVTLGRELFADPRLSKHGLISCSSCHDVETTGAATRALSPDDGGLVGHRNAPTVFNAGRQVAQFWDGRSATLESQAGEPLLGEMGMGSGPAVVAMLRSHPEYEALFAAAFPGDGPALTFDHATAAIARYEASLVTPSRWDDYLRGNHSALTPREVEGLKVFADVGCVQCHTGELVGGSMFQRLGRAEAWPSQADQGRYELTKDAADRMVFKVPSLRNVTRTAPYFHDGSVQDLRIAVHMAGRYQLGIDLTADQVDSIVQWLGALAGKGPAPR